MKILITSYHFFPDVGGLEQTALLLAREFVRQGHEVRVVTESAGTTDEIMPFEIFRKVNWRELVRLFWWADVCWQNNFSFRLGWPAVLFSVCPVVITTQTFYGGEPYLETLLWRVKRVLIRRHRHVILCAEMKHEFPKGDIIPNPFDENLFRQLPSGETKKDLIFVGRLVSDKGVEDLLKAVLALSRSVKASLTIVGKGPEEERLRGFCRSNGLEGHVVFLGVLRGERLTEMMNAHRIMVVPSLWREPFGIVALEGMACGCRLVVPDRGGLPDAVGAHGILYRHRDAEDLAAKLGQAIAEYPDFGEMNPLVKAHLAGFTSRAIAEKYLQILFEEQRGREKLS